MAWRFAHHFRRDDLEDVRQEVALRVFQNTHRFDPTRGRRAAFVSVVAKHRILQLIERQEARKRGYGRTVQPAPWDQDWLTDRRNTPQRVDLAIDVRDAMGRMPSDVRAVVELRMSSCTVAEIRKQLGLTRHRAGVQLRRAGNSLHTLRNDSSTKSQNPHPSNDGPGSEQVGEHAIAPGASS
jgi:RNA polymerase sigma factor (sigma-70 family)